MLIQNAITVAGECNDTVLFSHWWNIPHRTVEHSSQDRGTLLLLSTPEISRHLKSMLLRNESGSFWIAINLKII
jgi:hypothetical protein